MISDISPNSKNKIQLTADTGIEEGIYFNLSSEDYHGDKSSISRTSLMDFKKNHRLYWAKHLNPDRPPPETKPSWEFGTAFHMLILEPHLFEKHYFVLPEKVLLKDVGREKYDEYKAIEREAESLQDKVVLSCNDSRSLFAMQANLYGNRRAKSLIEGAIYESSYFWKDEHSGLMLKCRPDILHPHIYVDLKTIDDASPENYQREMVKFGYHIQGAITRDGVFNRTRERIQAVYNICIEKKYPHLIGIYRIDEAALEAGHCEYKQILLDMKHAIHDNVYKDYEIQTISLPTWYSK